MLKTRILFRKKLSFSSNFFFEWKAVRGRRKSEIQGEKKREKLRVVRESHEVWSEAGLANLDQIQFARKQGYRWHATIIKIKDNTKQPML